MYPMTVTIHNDAQLAAVLSAMGGNVLAREVPLPTCMAPKEQVVKEKPTAAPASPQSGAALLTTATESAPVKLADDKVFTIDDAKELTKTVVVAGKRDGMVALLKKFGVTQAVKLKPEQVADFCIEAQGLLV